MLYCRFVPFDNVFIGLNAKFNSNPVAVVPPHQGSNETTGFLLFCFSCVYLNSNCNIIQVVSQIVANTVTHHLLTPNE